MTVDAESTAWPTRGSVSRDSIRPARPHTCRTRAASVEGDRKESLRLTMQPLLGQGEDTDAPAVDEPDLGQVDHDIPRARGDHAGKHVGEGRSGRDVGFATQDILPDR